MLSWVKLQSNRSIKLILSKFSEKKTVINYVTVFHLLISGSASHIHKFTRQVRSTMEGNIFSRVCPSVHRGKGDGITNPWCTGTRGDSPPPRRGRGLLIDECPKQLRGWIGIVSLMFEFEKTEIRNGHDKCNRFHKSDWDKAVFMYCNYILLHTMDFDLLKEQESLPAWKRKRRTTRAVSCPWHFLPGWGGGRHWGGDYPVWSWLGEGGSGVWVPSAGLGQEDTLSWSWLGDQGRGGTEGTLSWFWLVRMGWVIACPGPGWGCITGSGVPWS